MYVSGMLTIHKVSHSSYIFMFIYYVICIDVYTGSYMFIYIFHPRIFMYVPGMMTIDKVTPSSYIFIYVYFIMYIHIYMKSIYICIYI